MQLTVSEMALLCVFHAGSLPATLDVLQSVAAKDRPHPKMAEIKSLADKLSQMKDGDNACLAFESAE